MTIITVTKTLLLDPFQTADSLEVYFEACLPPVPAGFYLPGQDKPVLEEGKYYYVKKADGTPSVIAAIEDITGPVYNQEGEEIVSQRRYKQLLQAPSTPYRGMAIIEAVINAVIKNASAWQKGDHFKCLSDAVIGELDETYRQRHTHDQLVEISERILECLSDLRTDVRDFIGDDKWIMHFQRRWTMTNIVVEKTIDYRIYDWEQRMQNGEWSEE